MDEFSDERHFNIVYQINITERGNISSYCCVCTAPRFYSEYVVHCVAQRNICYGLAYDEVIG